MAPVSIWTFDWPAATGGGAGCLAGPGTIWASTTSIQPCPEFLDGSSSSWQTTTPLGGIGVVPTVNCSPHVRQRAARRRETSG
jgi:hypothetical protein